MQRDVCPECQHSRPGQHTFACRYFGEGGAMLMRAEKAEADLEGALNTIALDQGSIRVLVEERDLFKAAWEASADVAKKAVEDMAAERIKRKEAEAKLTSPPAPAGWQQRIAAMDPYLVTQYDDQRCFFCGEYSEDDHKPDCLWQNAKDALPPAPEGSPVKPLQPVCPCCSTVLTYDGWTSVRIRSRWSCSGCNRTIEIYPLFAEADASPKEPRA